MFLPEPNPEKDEVLILMLGWEVGLYSPSLLEGEGLKALTAMIYGMMSRICIETSFLSVSLTQAFETAFPSGKLDA